MVEDIVKAIEKDAKKRVLNANFNRNIPMI